MEINVSYLILILGLAVSLCVVTADDEAADEAVNEEVVDYAKGSMCQHCHYCEFCPLCDEQCPCETGPGKPACKMCKYCKYCKLCRLCDTICQPGGILDKVSAAIVNSLDFSEYNKEEVEEDLDSVKHWIDKKREEL